MRIIAPMMILIMMTSTLAGCTGGDPDSGGNDNIDMDVINSLIDDNLQDFINNTTITVENHYHNNTTIVNNDNSQTNISGSSSGMYTGNYSEGVMVQLIDLRFSLNDLMNIDEIDFRNNSFEYNYTYYDYLTNENRQDLFSMSCSNFYLVGSGNSSSGEIPYWLDNSGYYTAWDTLYNNTIRDLLDSIAQADWLREICDETFYDGQNYYNNLLLYEIEVPEGTALQCTFTQSGYPMMEQYYWNDHTSLWDDSSNGAYNGGITYPDGQSPYLYDNVFYVSMYYLSTPWGCSEGFAGGSEDSTVSIQVDHIVPNYEYRLQLYYQFVPVNFVSNSGE